MYTTTNKIRFLVIGVALGVMCTLRLAMGGNLTIPKTWGTTTPETLTATDLNNNFQATETAVNGNANDISTNASNIANNSLRLPQVKTVNSTAVKQITSGSGENVLSISVTPPADGFVMVFASGTMGVVMTNQTLSNIRLDASLSTTTGTMDSANRTTLTWSSSTPERMFVPLNIVGVFPVNQDIESSFFLNAQIVDGIANGNFYIGDVSDVVKLTAVFVPLALP